MIRADLTGSNRATALGITARGYAPVSRLARNLIDAGIDPASPMEVYRGETLALRVNYLAAVARLTVKDDNRGTPPARKMDAWRSCGLAHAKTGSA